MNDYLNQFKATNTRIKLDFVIVEQNTGTADALLKAKDHIKVP